MKRSRETINEERKMILEMINASWELADRLGKHAPTAGCSCIACVIRRKRLIAGRTLKWKYEL